MSDIKIRESHTCSATDGSVKLPAATMLQIRLLEAASVNDSFAVSMLMRDAAAELGRLYRLIGDYGVEMENGRNELAALREALAIASQSHYTNSK